MTVAFQANESNASTTEVREVAASGEQSRRVPFTLPSSETYYWTFRWQRDEDETLADGDSITFDSNNPDDAAAWLRESEDDDED